MSGAKVREAAERLREATRRMVGTPTHVEVWNAISQYRSARTIPGLEQSVVRIEFALLQYFRALLAALDEEEKAPDTAIAREARYRRLLNAIEWYAVQAGKSEFCLFCGRFKNVGHTDNCLLRTALAEGGEEKP